MALDKPPYVIRAAKIIWERCVTLLDLRPVSVNSNLHVKWGCFLLITGIRVIIEGSSRTHWTQTQNTPSQLRQPAIQNSQNERKVQCQPKIIHYQANEVYLNTRSYLERGMDGKRCGRVVSFR